MDYTIIQYYGKQNNSSCGYCKSHNSNTHGMHAYYLQPQDYQYLIDRGWRRSGHYCYKPNMKITCCPCYTIRCDSSSFKLSKSHKKILKRMNKFLKDGIKSKDNLSEKDNAEDNDLGVSVKEEPDIPNHPKQQLNLDEISIVNGQRAKTPDQLQEPVQVLETAVGSTTSKSESGVPNYIPQRKKAKQMRLERKQTKLAAQGKSLSDVKPKNNPTGEKSLTDFISDISENNIHKLQLKLVEVNSAEFRATLPVSYETYKKYQTHVHNDSIPESVSDYVEFLGNSPVKTIKSASSPPDGFGSFHQQYWLDDKLIAVGVIDILPNCVSSVYFFYDPDYSFLSLGTYSSLREMEFTQKLSELVPSLKYYYMGFYIHSCPKMRYKGNLVPSFLLCPETYIWNSLTDDIRKRLDECKYQRLNADSKAGDVDEFTENNDLDAVSLLVDKRICSYRQYIQSFNIDTLDNFLDRIRSVIYEEVTGDNDERNIIVEYGKLVGKTCAHRMLYLMITE